jgi:hypothetical protein
MKPREAINAYADAFEEELLTANGFDDAIVGIVRQFSRTFVVYDLEKVIRTLMRRDGMTREDAEEWFEFNIVGSWVGQATPGFLIRWQAL